MASPSDPIPRLLAPRVREALADTPVVLIHGPRQSGKTTLARLVGEKRGYRYYSFDEDAVRAFHANAILSGWTDAGSPGPRQGAMTLYYAAFVQDPDGNKLEAANFPRKA